MIVCFARNTRSRKCKVQHTHAVQLVEHLGEEESIVGSEMSESHSQRSEVAPFVV